MKKIAIIGAGSWGTALAVVLGGSPRPHRIALWPHSADVLDALRAHRVNHVYLPSFELPACVEVASTLPEALADAEIVLGVMPAAYARDVYRAMRPYVNPRAAFVSATKGLEPSSHARISEVIAQEWARGASAEKSREGTAAAPPRIAILAGPGFAVEVARGDPTAVVLGSADFALAAEIQEEFSGPTFRLYTNDDVTGTEMAGAVKNVIAIAAGVCTGLGFGANTLAALITRGLAEMTRLAVALGGRRDTLSGLAGVGDVILTCSGELSRNRMVGVELGRGRSLAEVLGSMRMVAEGVGTTAATIDLARRAGVEMPIAEQVNAVLTGKRTPRDAIRELMVRPLKQE